ncbi:MAG TPA: hypothetical protein PKA28_15305 [Methylomusa anaerophila]|uniref:hypothetical protein n=1 Tax=Methylomusa anaerophila TaxID=1930071 RepID=UPI0018D560F0|nr:hypothetical protein [Methylomusa anaerophila]HML89809.1 hypothetical protein [Methylomusa anaerophila]
MMDAGASVIARLKNKAQTSGLSFQVHLRLFCQEEFLRRLSLSKYADNLVLKGGLFLFFLSGFESTDYDRSSFAEIISFSENDAMLVKWRQFLRRTKLPGIEFSEVTGLINTFLGGIWNAIIDENEWLKNWNCQTTSW